MNKQQIAGQIKERFRPYMVDDMKLGRIVRFLADVKLDFVADTGRMIGGCGYIAAMRYIDEAICRLIMQQTEIEDIRNLLAIEREENARYHSKYGEIDDEEELDSVSKTAEGA